MGPSERTLPGRPDALMSAGIFLAALAPRILHVLEIRASGLGSFLRLDPLYYHEWGRRVASGEWLGREAFEMSPLYPYTLGALYAVFGEGLLLPRILQALLGALTCAAIFLLGLRLFGRAAGLLAGLALAFYGPAIFYDGQINKTTLALALTVGFAGALALSGARHRGWAAAGGVLLGLAALVHENVNLAAPPLFLWLAWPRHGEPRASGLKVAALFTAGYFAVVLPVTARNLAVSGELVLITSAGGENFYTGNNPHASGRYSPPPFVRPDPFFEHEDFRVEAARRLGRPVTRREASRFWWMEGARFIAENPGRFAWLLWDKFSVFFNAFERPDNFSYMNFRKFSPTLALPWPGFAAVIPLGLLGLVLSAGRWRELLPLYAGMGAYIASALVFFTQSRYRMPALPFFCLFAGYGAVRLLGMLRQRRWRAATLSAGLAAGALLFVTRDPGNAPGFHAQNQAILGELYLRSGQPDKAAAHLRRGIEEMRSAARAGNPVFARISGAAQLGLGLAELERGRPRRAEEAFRAAAAGPDPDVARDAARELARLLESRGDRAGAAGALARLLEVDPEDHAARLRRARLLYGLGRHAEMESELRTLLEARPPAAPAQQADAWFGLALSHAARGRRRPALEAVERVLAIDPGRRDAADLRRQLASGGGAS